MYSMRKNNVFFVKNIKVNKHSVVGRPNKNEPENELYMSPFKNILLLCENPLAGLSFLSRETAEFLIQITTKFMFSFSQHSCLVLSCLVFFFIAYECSFPAANSNLGWGQLRFSRWSMDIIQQQFYLYNNVNKAQKLFIVIDELSQASSRSVQTNIWPGEKKLWLIIM